MGCEAPQYFCSLLATLRAKCGERRVGDAIRKACLQGSYEGRHTGLVGLPAECPNPPQGLRGRQVSGGLGLGRWVQPERLQ